MSTEKLLKKGDDRSSLSSTDSERNVRITSTRNPSQGDRYVAWGSALWPLVIHGVLSIAIACFTVYYVNGNHFNIAARKPLVSLADGTMVPWSRYTPLQTDITTLLSTFLALLRLVTACWLGPLCWRCAFILLETTGLRVKQLFVMMSYGFPTSIRQGDKVTTSIVLVILVIVLPVYVSAPVLIGSITWVPSSHRPELLTNATINIPGSNNLAALWMWWLGNDGRKELAERAAALSFVAWGRDTQNDAMKRILLPTARLGLNSTLTSAILPYFSVTAIEWVEDPANTLTSDQLSVYEVSCPKLSEITGSCPLQGDMTGGVPGKLALIPDPPWTNTTSSSTFTGKRLMAMHTSDHGIVTSMLSSNPCSNPIVPISGVLPSNIGIYQDPTGLACWAFAWVTFTAGAGLCHNCRVSSYATVQNDTALVLQDDPLTNNALRIMPNVIAAMMETNSSNVGASWGSVDDHVIGLLSRSYAVSWMALTGGFSDSEATTYSVAPPSSLASVYLVRVYIWLGLQCLVTISGLLFLYLQLRSGSPIIGDTTLAAFFLDSSGVSNGQYDLLKGGATRKVDYQDDRLTMKVRVSP